MTLLSPQRLWLLLAVAGLAALYLWAQRRRRHRAVRFSNLPLLASVAPRRPGWRRHVPAAGFALGLAALILGLAEPARAVRVPKEAATVMLVLDSSASMEARDVSPSRIEAATDAAKAFVEELPPSVQVGLITFDRSPRLIASPTADHQAVLDGLDNIVLGPGTGAGTALYTALDAIEAAGEAAGTSSGTGGKAPRSLSEEITAAVVLLSDGVTTVGSPLMAAAAKAAEAGVPVSTIAFGTDSGTVVVQGELIPVPADPETMEAVAEATDGRFFEAESAGELRSVYEDIGRRIGWETVQRSASGPILAAGAFALTGAFALALAWNGRLV